MEPFVSMAHLLKKVLVEEKLIWCMQAYSMMSMLYCIGTLEITTVRVPLLHWLIKSLSSDSTDLLPMQRLHPTRDD
jgi:hypothetical protein